MAITMKATLDEATKPLARSGSCPHQNHRAAHRREAFPGEKVDGQGEDFFEVSLLISFNWWFDEIAKVSTTTNTIVAMICSTDDNGMWPPRTAKSRTGEGHSAC
jgi:hypothetical protein